MELKFKVVRNANDFDMLELYTEDANGKYKYLWAVIQSDFISESKDTYDKLEAIYERFANGESIEFTASCEDIDPYE